MNKIGRPKKGTHRKHTHMQRTMMTQAMKDKLSAYSEITGKNESEIIRSALNAWFEAQKQKT